MGSDRFPVRTRPAGRIAAGRRARRPDPRRSVGCLHSLEMDRCAGPRSAPCSPGLLVAALLAVGEKALAGDPPLLRGVGLTETWPGVTFDKPMVALEEPGGTGYWVVLEQGGVVKRLAMWSGQGPVPQPTVFLDLSAKVFPRMQGGLQCLAFDPRYQENRKVYVTYVAGSPQQGFHVVLSEFRTNGQACDVTTERPLLYVPKSLAMHNGSWLAFGPDGMLWMSTGDNAKQKEALQTSQNPNNLLGKILRIDVSRADPGLPYAIPADNPWAAVQQGVRREIWAYGMRNPWRCSFDAEGNLWTTEPGTKGAGCHESVVRIEKGKNHGWPFFEGTRPMEPIPPNLQGQAFVKPVFEYLRDEGDDLTAGIGGYIVRGSRCPPLKGRYVSAGHRARLPLHDRPLEREGGGLPHRRRRWRAPAPWRGRQRRPLRLLLRRRQDLLGGGGAVTPAGPPRRTRVSRCPAPRASARRPGPPCSPCRRP